jgi:hypothetical protein
MDRVEQAVMYGSVYEALYCNFINIDNIMQYLLVRESKNENERKRLCVAYRIVCIFNKDQLVPKDFALTHFVLLTENEDYIAIYTLSFGSCSSNMNLTQKLQSHFPKLNANKFRRFYNVICESTSNFNDNDGEYIAKIRSLKNLKNCTNLDLLLDDYLDALNIMNEKLYLQNLINRCCLLRKVAPLYWQYVAYNLYRPFVERKYSQPYFSKKTVSLLCECFPQLYPDNVLKRSDIAFELYNLPKVVAAYNLGFPIHEYIPSEDKINKTIDLLSDLGSKKYLENLTNKEINDVFNVLNVKIVNLENVHFDKIDDFNAFDIVHYYTDSKDCMDIKHLFRFTRPEFQTILKDKKNFYTGEPIPSFVLEEIKTRMRLAKEYKLPKSKILKELLQVENKVEDVEFPILNVELEGNIEEEEQDEEENDEEQDEEEQDEEEQDEEQEEENDEVDFPFFVGRARNEDGEETFFRIQMDEELQEMEEEELDELMTEIMESRDMEYIGRVDCNCDTCGRDIIGEEHIEDI